MRSVTELWADGVLLTNAALAAAWSRPVVQAIVCTECSIEGCATGGWVAPRATDDAVVWLPAFERWHDELGGAFSPPAYVAQRGVPFFDRAHAAELARLVPNHPRHANVPRLRLGDVAALVASQAPRGTLVGPTKGPHSVDRRATLVVAGHADSVDALFATAHASAALVELVPRGGLGASCVPLELLVRDDGPVGATPWAPLVEVDGALRFALDDRVVVPR